MFCLLGEKKGFCLFMSVLFVLMYIRLFGGVNCFVQVNKGLLGYFSKLPIDHIINSRIDISNLSTLFAKQIFGFDK